MINAIISLCLKNKLIVLMGTFLLFLISLWAIQNTRLDALPDLSPTQVVVQVSYPNQSPQVVQEQAVYPLVANFMGIADIETVRGSPAMKRVWSTSSLKMAWICILPAIG